MATIKFLKTDGSNPMLGNLALSGNPTSNLHAASKQYVDSLIPTIGGANTQVQFNDSGFFGGDPNFTWDKTIQTLTVGNPSSGIIQGATNPGVGDGGQLRLTGGLATNVGNSGGQLVLQGGSPTDGNGGSVAISGTSGIGTNRMGGTVIIEGGTSTGTAVGGEVSIDGGVGIAANGGDVGIFGGNSFGVPGDGGGIIIRGGFPADGNGGNINIVGSNASGTNRSGGAVEITSGDATGTGFAGDINLTTGNADTTSPGGNVNILAGDGGSVSGTSFGGNISLQSGDGQDQGGDVLLQAGAGNLVRGGDIIISAGLAGPPIAPGNVRTIMSGGFKTTRTGNFGGDGDAQTGEYILRAETVDATITEMFLDGSAMTRRMFIPILTTWKWECHVVARRTVVANESAGYQYAGVIDNNAGTTALVGTVQTIMAEQEDSAAWAVTITADNTNDALRIQVTGEVGKIIRWVAFVRTVEVTG